MKPNVWSRPAQSKKNLCAPAAAELLWSLFQRLVCVRLALALPDCHAFQPPLCSPMEDRQWKALEASLRCQYFPLQTPCCTIPCEKSAQQAAGSRYVRGTLNGSLLNAVPLNLRQGSRMLHVL